MTNWSPPLLRKFFQHPRGSRGKIIATIFTMGIDMLGGDSDINPCVWINLHSIWIVLHSLPHVFGPLTADIVGNHNPWQKDEHKCTENKIVHVAVPSHYIKNNRSKRAMENLLFPQIEVSYSISTNKNMPRTQSEAGT